MLQRCTQVIKTPYFWVITVLIGIDQITKWLVRAEADLWPKPLTPFLNIVLVKNRGISFGLLNISDEFVFWALTSIIAGIIFYVIYLLCCEKNNIMRWGFSLVLGGAISNIIDRLLHQGVIDFIDLHIQSLHWPAFNFADGFIFMGTALLLKQSLKETK